MCYDFLLFIHILEDVPFSKGTRADFQQKVSSFVSISYNFSLFDEWVKNKGLGCVMVLPKRDKISYSSV